MVQSAEAVSAAAKSAAAGTAPRNRRTASATPQSGAATTRTAASKIGSVAVVTALEISRGEVHDPNRLQGRGLIGAAAISGRRSG